MGNATATLYTRCPFSLDCDGHDHGARVQEQEQSACGRGWPGSDGRGGVDGTRVGGWGEGAERLQWEGHGSSAAGGEPLRFQWTGLTGPAGSHTALTDAATATPSFVA